MEIKQNNYRALVRCYTYNHSAYIQDALNGFSLQITDFPFICVVVDDCSSDGSQSAIREWMTNECNVGYSDFCDSELAEFYFAEHKNNKNCNFAFYLLKKNLNGTERKKELIEPWIRLSKYEAICEGDDYWTDPRKLQEQVDFLENHTSFSATSSNALIITSLVNKDFYQLKEILVERQFHTASVVMRISSIRKCPHYRKGGWDTFQWCCLLSQGPIHYDAKVTCVYRKQNQGISETTSTLNWLSKTSRWADILTECFVPDFVRRKYIVRSVTKGIIMAFFKDDIRHVRENRDYLQSLYIHNFCFLNIPYDLKEVLKQLIKIVYRKRVDYHK